MDGVLWRSPSCRTPAGLCRRAFMYWTSHRSRPAVTKGRAGSEHTSMSADNDVDRLRRLHHRSTEIQRRSLNQAWEFFPPRMNQCDKERANETQSSQFMLFSVL